MQDEKKGNTVVLHFLLFVILGLIVGSVGTLIGVGGGFILVPILLFLHPDKSPELITSVSLAVVFCNAFAGALAYARQRRIDYRSGMLFAASTIPGAILGAYSTAYLSRQIFNIVLGLVMIAGLAFMLMRRERAAAPVRNGAVFEVSRNIVATDGAVHVIHYNRMTGIAVSLAVGYISSVLGIGGGIIHVPVLINVLHFPVQIATATSLFVLCITAFTGTAVHAYAGIFSQGMIEAIPLAIGVLLGAPWGARISVSIHDPWITRALAAALALVGLRIIFMAFK